MNLINNKLATGVRKLLLMVGLMLAAANITAQTTQKVTLTSGHPTTLLDIFHQVERQTKLVVAFNTDDVKTDKVVTPTKTTGTLAEVMTNILASTGYSWQLNGKYIVVFTKKATPDTGKGAFSTMARDNFDRERMRFVPDPWSKTQKPFKDMVNTRVSRISADPAGKDSTNLTVVNYRVNNTTVERGYMDNALALDRLDRLFRQRDILSGIDYIVITAAASPEGNTAGNEVLAEKRALALKTYIMWKFPFFDRDMIYTFSIGEDWTGLRKMVAADQYTPFRTEVLSLLESYLDSNAKRAALKNIGNGRAYSYIAQYMLPKLRGGAALSLHYKIKPSAEVIIKEKVIEKLRVDTVYIHTRDSVEKIIEKNVETNIAPSVEKNAAAIVAAPTAPGSGRPYYLAAKSNLLYDAILLPNVALEFSLPQRWSIETEGMWSWWGPAQSKHLYHRIQAGGLEVRKWMGKPDLTPLTGHFFGVYGYYGNYDIRLGDTGYQDPHGSWSAGLTYGYSMPLNRSFNLEFSLGVGYVTGEYYTYSYDDSYNRYPWESTRKLKWIGPTKAKISLVWLIGSGKNPKKNNNENK